jgi:hypothetical protein
MTSDSVHRAINSILIIFGIALVAFFLYRQGQVQPDHSTTTIDTSRHDIVINNWQPKGTTVFTAPEQPNYSGLDASKLLSAIQELRSSFDSLRMEYYAVNRYDTILNDTSYKESISIDVSKNRIARFTRNMEVYNRTTITVKPQRFAVNVGAFGYVAKDFNAFGPMITGITKKGDAISIGYDAINKGWMAGIQYRIKLRK